ncbi:cytochrome-c oxidase, cbb3-type subunit III [Telmatospirillum sp. J64-1]|uniref:cytochrome-c oxidase, cbb3-type subunit III n=1 Tax=Telmatospirillum sp. J64-1 TaxID=2502183 RepID=UPI00115D80F8|nr:cytochrome-c oxidase, cbb3-type subunit III [Telmatospirillum sp. J64-1]
MASVEKDHVSGQDTTGHEWDGIKELNTPIPKWWVYVFFACILWSVGYWFVYPAWPTLNSYTKGAFGYSSRGQLVGEMEKAREARASWEGRFTNASVEEIAADRELLTYAMAGGRALFGENCAPCHGAGGVGAFGYPALVDDQWIWGGSLEDIQYTITHGVRNETDEARIGEMPAFGRDGILSTQEINLVAEYVLSLSGNATDAAAARNGEEIYLENCAACHMDDGSGMRELGAPPLNNNLWLFNGTKEGVVAQITNPRHGSMPAWGLRMSENDIKLLTVYVHSLGGGE